MDSGEITDSFQTKMIQFCTETKLNDYMPGRGLLPYLNKNSKYIYFIKLTVMFGVDADGL